MSDRTFKPNKAGTSNSSNSSLVSPHTPTLANPVRGFGLPTNNIIQTQTAESINQQQAPSADEQSLLSPAIEQWSFGHDFSRIALRRPQAKLTVGEAGDKYEQEADWMANQVMRMVVPDKLNNHSIQPGQDSLLSEANQQRSFGHDISRIALHRPQAKLTVGERGAKEEGESLQNIASSGKHGLGTQLPTLVNPSIIQCAKIDYRSLVWDDFTGKVPRKSTFDASTYTGYEPPNLSKVFPNKKDLTAVDTGEVTQVGKKEISVFKVDTQINSGNIEVKPYMWQERSWVKNPSTDLLVHEQTHFDITHTMAKTAESALRFMADAVPSEATGNGKTQAINNAWKLIRKANQDIIREWKSRLNDWKSVQNQYDSEKEADHGRNVDKQAEWTERYKPKNP